MNKYMLLFLTAPIFGLLGQSSMSPTAQAVHDEKVRSIQTAASKLTAGDRLSDPFGIPPAANISSSQQEEARRSGESNSNRISTQQAGNVPATAEMALANLPIDGIDPFNREFYVGARSVYQGDVITIAFMGQTWDLVVSEVRSRAIFFEEPNTGRKHRVDISIIPQTLDFPTMEAP